MSRKKKPVPLLAQHHARPLTIRVTDLASLHDASKLVTDAWGPNVIAAVEKKMTTFRASAELPAKNPPGSAVWYAEKLLEQIARVRRSMARDDKDRILNEGMVFGSLWKEAKTIVLHGRSIDHGLKQYPRMRRLGGDSNESRKRRATAKHKRWKEAAAILWQRNPSLSAEACARLVIKNLNLTEKPRTVRRVIACVQPK